MTENFKDIFILLAKYNQITNLDVVKVLQEVESDKLKENLGSYFSSILGILNHQLFADVGWIRALGTYITSLDFVPPLLEHLPTKRPPLNVFTWVSLDEYQSVRTEIDYILERVVMQLDSSDYASVFTNESRRGKIEYVTWRVLLHLFNHHTHHRGGISVLHDQLGIKNDYSSLLWKIQ